MGGNKFSVSPKWVKSRRQRKRRKRKKEKNVCENNGQLRFRLPPQVARKPSGPTYFTLFIYDSDLYSVQYLSKYVEKTHPITKKY